MISWFARSPDHYTARGMAAIRTRDGWFARVGNRARGPLPNLDLAMEVAAEMLSRASKVEDAGC